MTLVYFVMHTHTHIYMCMYTSRDVAYPVQGRFAWLCVMNPCDDHFLCFCEVSTVRGVQEVYWPIWIWPLWNDPIQLIPVWIRNIVLILGRFNQEIWFRRRYTLIRVFCDKNIFWHNQVEIILGIRCNVRID